MGDVRGASSAGVLAEPLADELTRGGALRFAALFHDLGKPETRARGEGGRVLFIGHDRAGARIVRDLCRRLRASRRLGEYLANLTLNHLRLGFLVHERPLSRRQVYDYLRATDPDSVGRDPADRRGSARHPGGADQAGGDRRPPRAGRAR